MTEFSLDILLKAIKLARSTYYYHLKQLDKPDKDQELKAEVQLIFIEHKGNYGYRRTELERLQAENDYLRAENVILKKLRELRLKEKKEKEERPKLFKN